MTWAAVLGFVAAVTPLVLTPGASFTLATQRSLAGDRHAAGWVIAGTATGIYCHALLAALGLSAIVLRSAQAFTAVKVAGGVYLIGLGILALGKTRRRPPPPTLQPPTPGRRLPWAGHHAHPQAVLANVLNPKAASVYLTIAPQFLSAHRVGVAPMLILATAHIALMAIWLTVWSFAVRRGRTLTRSARPTMTVQRLGGAVLIGLGVRTAVTP